MSRKDWELIAECIKRARYYDASPQYALALDRVTGFLNTEFITNHDNYKAELFLSACEYGKLPRESEVEYDYSR